MDLLKIPGEIWRCILFDWVELSDVIRFDLSASYKSNHPLRLLYSEHVFCLSEYQTISAKQLDKLLLWMKSRHVYLEEISIRTNARLQWGRLLKWTGGRIRSLTLCAFNTFESLIEVASQFCSKLESLSILHCSTSAKIFRTLLANNLFTLKSLSLDNFRVVGDLDVVLPQLKLADLSFESCKSSMIRSLLLKSAHLSALSVDGINFNNRLTEWLAPSCRNLRELCVHRGRDMDNGALLHISQRCPNIEFLSISDCDSTYFQSIGEVVGTLTKLQKLEIPFDFHPLKDIGLYGSQSLRAVEFIGRISGYASLVPEHSFITFSHSCPSLAALILNRFCYQCTLCALENCPNLTYLEIGDIGPANDAVMRSAALYCPLLRTLNLSYCSRYYYTPEGIDEVLVGCTQLDTLVLADSHLYSRYYNKIQDPAVRARVMVLREGNVHLSTWAPP